MTSPDILDLQRLARADAFALPIDQIDVTKPRLFQTDTIGHYFERLRRDDPVHWHANDFYGGFWSVTRYQDIMAMNICSRWSIGASNRPMPPWVQSDENTAWLVSTDMMSW